MTPVLESVDSSAFPYPNEMLVTLASCPFVSPRFAALMVPTCGGSPAEKRLALTLGDGLDNKGVVISRGAGG